MSVLNRWKKGEDNSAKQHVLEKSITDSGKQNP